jgi:hypothetical protein
MRLTHRAAHDNGTGNGSVLPKLPFGEGNDGLTKDIPPGAEEVRLPSTMEHSAKRSSARKIETQKWHDISPNLIDASQALR